MTEPAPLAPFPEGLDREEQSAHAADAADPLSRLRAAFVLPRGLAPDGDTERLVYLCGNSLGLMPRAAREALLEELDDWGALAVDGHFRGRHPWYAYHEPLAAPLGRVVGARPDEVVAMNGLTVNLHLLLASFYRPTRARPCIAIEANAFPSDRYVAQSQAELHADRLGLDDPHDAVLEIAPSRPGATLTTDDVVAFLQRHGERVATLLLGGVHYYAGTRFDLRRITEAGHAMGCVVGFDLAHAAGNVPCDLHDVGADFAAWCSYKYLNSGPGSVACAFVHERHGMAPELPRMAGWWGNDPDRRFSMPERFVPQRGAAGWQLSNAPVLSMAPLRASLALFDEATMPALRARSLRLTGYLLALLDDGLAAVGRTEALQVITPRHPDERGAQLSLRFPAGAHDIQRALQARGVVADFRRPDVIRLAPAPLYTRFVDVWRTAEVIVSTVAAA